MKFYILEISFLLNKIPEKLTDVFGVQSGGGCSYPKAPSSGFFFFFSFSRRTNYFIKEVAEIEEARPKDIRSILMPPIDGKEKKRMYDITSLKESPRRLVKSN